MEKSPEMTDEEIAILIHEFEIRKPILDCDIRTCDTNRKKGQAWQEIKAKVDAISICSRSVKQLKIKLKNIKSRAKNKHSTIKRSSQANGGGPASKLALTEAEQRICSLYQNSSSWRGIPGGQSSASINNDNIQGGSLPTWPISTGDEEDSDDKENEEEATVETSPFTPTRREPFRSRLQKLQIEALETQIEANRETISTMKEIRNSLIPALLGKSDWIHSIFKD